MEQVEISLSKKEFEEKKECFLKQWEVDSPNDEVDMAQYKIVPLLEVDESKFEDDVITVNASMHHDGDYFGYITIDIPVTTELAADIIDSQVKKYNKIKTILEATK